MVVVGVVEGWRGGGVEGWDLGLGVAKTVIAQLLW